MVIADFFAQFADMHVNGAVAYAIARASLEAIQIHDLLDCFVVPSRNGAAS
jgi:hypothetical protein